MNSVVCVTGFGWSGSGAVVDLLREYDDIDMLDNNGKDFEFSLLATRDGIYDLEHVLTYKNFRLGSSMAITAFLDFVSFCSTKRGYEKIFKNQFEKLSKEYIESLVDFKFEGWTFYDVRYPSKANKRKAFYNKIISHIFNNRITTHIPVSVKIWNKLLLKVQHPILVSIFPDDFLPKTKKYIRSLLDIHHIHPNYPLVVDQMFPPDNPAMFFKYVDNSKCIVVRRDPRDTYLLAKCGITYMSVPLPVANVDDFITFYRKVIEASIKPDSDKMLSIRFEDLIYEYDNTVKKIEDFLGINQHVRKNSMFNPNVSINNTQLSRKYKEYEDDIKKIEMELPNSLYDFDKYHFERTSSEIF